MKTIIGIVAAIVGQRLLMALATGVNDCIPIYEPGGTLTCHASGAITGKRFVKVSADAQGSGGMLGLDSTADGGNFVVAQVTASGDQVLGVANRDVASGGKIGVLCTPGIIVPVTRGAAITAGQEVMSDTSGRAIPYAEAAGKLACGKAMADDNGTEVPVKLYGVAVRHPA